VTDPASPEALAEAVAALEKPEPPATALPAPKEEKVKEGQP
jgi:hypothetical protein